MHIFNKIKKSKISIRVISAVLCLSYMISVFQLLPMLTKAFDDVDIYVVRDGEKIDELIINSNEHVNISAKTSGFVTTRYQWQILADRQNELWVDVYDMRSEEAEVSYALISPVMDESNSAYIRCVAILPDKTVCSSPVCVTVHEQAKSNVQGSLGAPVLSAARAKAPVLLGEPAPEYAYITINYLSAESPDKKVFTPYVAKIAYDSTYSQVVPSPTQIGFAPYYSGVSGDSDPENAEYSAQAISVNYNPGDGDIVYNVYYKAIDVPYAVKYFFQNINDDGYTPNASISFNGMAKTGTIVSDETLNQPVFDYFGVDENEDFGFSPLYHYPESVAADGSTVFECYYDRNYYLIKFDLDGGYGVEPIYARFGSSFVITPPNKAGFVFKGWDIIDSYTYDVYIDVDGTEVKVDTVVLNAEQYVEKGSPSAFVGYYTSGGTEYPDAVYKFVKASGDGIPDKPEDTSKIPLVYNGTVEAKAANYKAIWETTTTTYTIVYWAENADDSGYSYWGNKLVSTQSATVLTDFDAIVAANSAASASLTDAKYFTYNSDKTKFVNGDGVLVEGDGSTIINVYYSRNTYDLLFYDSVTKCYVPEHVHSDSCYAYDCTSTHVHTADCCKYGLNENPHTELCCGLENHAHGEECLVNCTIPEHTHTVACCTLSEHTHTAACCNKEVHTHTAACITCSHVHTAACYGVTIAGSATVPNGNGWDNRNDNKDFMNQLGLTSGYVYYYDDRKVNNAKDHYILYLDGMYYNLTQAEFNNIKDGDEVASGDFTGTGTLPMKDYFYKYKAKIVTAKCTHPTHDDSCYSCGKTEHTHSDGTCTYNCGQIVHTHGDGNCNHGCGMVEHTHSAACRYRCAKIEHTHSNSCCTVPAHTHQRSCYTLSGTFRSNNRDREISLGNATTPTWTDKRSVTVKGVTLWYDNQANTNQKYLYLKIGESYYRLNYSGTTGITYSNINNITALNLNRTCAYDVEHTHGDGNCTYNCIGYEHTHTDSCYGCGKKEHIHGDGNCNFAACTDPTHHVHTSDCLVCGFLSEHVHDESCPRVLECTQTEHSHTDGTCRTTASGSQVDSATRYLVYKITAKYNADIHAHWPINGYNGTTYSSANLYRWDPDRSNKLGLDSVLVYMDRMPGMESETNKSLTLLAQKSSGKSNITMHYCVQTIPGDSTAQYVNYLGEPAAINAGKGGASGYQFVTDYRRAGAYYTGITMDVDFIDLEGFEKYRLYTNSGVDIAYANNTTTRNGTDDYFYYLRKQYNLSFYNYNADWGTTNKIYYEQNMNPFNPGEPPYPSSLEAGAYEFEAWYTTPECYPGTEFDWNAVNKMPAKDVKLYAKWVPVKHTVRFFETYDKMKEYERSVANGTPDESLVYVKESMPTVPYSMKVDHGSFVGSLPNPDKLLVQNSGGSTSEYDFAGWFAVENEQKKAFTPLDMPITKDMNVYADWGTHTAQPYAVYYIVNDYETNSMWLNMLGEPTEGQKWKSKSVTIGGQHRNYLCVEENGVYRWYREVADKTRGYAYQGTTRTFPAKAGESLHQLYTDYDIDFNQGYYPTPASHSITMVYEENSLEPINNVFAFKYVHVDNVNYTVRYLDAANPDPGNPLHEEKVVSTGNAIVTERFVPIPNYVPDAFYKQCILAVTEDPDHPGVFVSSQDNVITFYYSKNTTSARYTVHFLLQKADSEPLNDSDFNVSFDTNLYSESYGTYSFSSKFEESGSRIDGVADKDTQIQISPIDFAGFNLVENKAKYSNGMGAAQNAAYSGGSYSITPVLDGTDLFIFYERESYPYKVYYLKYETPVSTSDLATYITKDEARGVLADTKGMSGDLIALYGNTYSENAIDIDGYVCVSAHTIEKAITPVVESNYIVFFYVPEQFTVQYVVAGGKGGELSATNETGSATSIMGSVAMALPGYKFAGWFIDPECTIPAMYDPSTNPDGKGTTYTSTLKETEAVGENGIYVMPDVAKMIPNGQEGANNNIFYAKFDPLVGELTVIRNNSDNEGNGDQVFVYEIRNKTTGAVYYVTITGNGSATVKGIPLGEYTVTQQNDWSHRFADASKDVTVSHLTGDSVTFEDAAVKNKWLNGNGHVAVNKKG